MKSITVVLFCVLVLILTCATSWSVPIQIGAIDLGSAGYGLDNLTVYNLSGPSGGFINEDLTFYSAQVTINGAALPTSFGDIASFDSASGLIGLNDYYSATGYWLSPDSISSIVFTASLDSSPVTVTPIGGSPELVSSIINFTYSGPVLDGDTNGDLFFPIYATDAAVPAAVPEPASVVLAGLGFIGLLIVRRRQA